MDIPRVLARLLFLLPLFGLSAVALPIEGGPGPYLVLGLCLAWARLGAALGRRRGRQEAILAFETLPFALWIAARLSDLASLEALVVGLAFFAYAALVLALEDLLLAQARGPGPVLAFLLAAALPGLLALGLPRLGLAWLLLGASALGLVLAGYARGRRER